MPKLPDFDLRDNGRYKSEGLASKDFDRLFNRIGKEQRKNRRSAKRQLTPGLLKNKNLDDVLKLGKKPGINGTVFTLDDLKGFESRREAIKAKFDKNTAGITYNQLVAHSLAIDVKRANNRVEDGSGITSAALQGIKHNVIVVSVTASQISVHQHHRVRIRLEEWDEAVENIADADKKQMKRVPDKLCAGRVSVDCDCGRWQYWYRYIGTAGNYAITPPKEYVFPKVRNPRLQGVACKHIIHALTRLQSGAWQVAVAKRLEIDARKVSFGDDKKRTTKYFTGADLRALMRNRKSQTNQGAARKAWVKYKKDQRAMQNKLAGMDQKKLDTSREQLKRVKKQNTQQKQQIKELKEREALLSQQLADALAVKRQTFIDALVMTGRTTGDAVDAWKKYLNDQTKGKK